MKKKIEEVKANVAKDTKIKLRNRRKKHPHFLLVEKIEWLVKPEGWSRSLGNSTMGGLCNHQQSAIQIKPAYIIDEENSLNFAC